MKFIWIIPVIIVVLAGWFIFAPKQSVEAPVQNISGQPESQGSGQTQQNNSGKTDAASTRQNSNPQLTKTTNNMPNLQIKSSVFVNNGKIPAKYTCDGDNMNPPLSISGTPATAKSLVLILDDPDAPGGTFNHWVVWDIPATASQISEGASAGGTAGMNSGGERGYFGPCPPSGTHRYIFKIYALDTILGLDSYSDSSAVKAAMGGHIIEQAQTIGLYR